MTRSNDTPEAAAAPPVAALPDRACAGANPEVFYPLNHTQLKTAVEICHRCPHEQPCLDWAVATRQRFGVWGGTGADERHEIIKTLEAT